MEINITGICNVLNILVVLLQILAMCICSRKYGDCNLLGLLMLFLRKHKSTKWLTFDLWGDSKGFFIRMQIRIDEWVLQNKRRN